MQGDRVIILHKGNAIVIVWADSSSDLPLITDIADKLSERLGMKVLDFNEPPAGTPDRCVFQYRFSCIKHSISDNDVTLLLKNSAGRDLVIRDVKVTSEAIKGGDCTTDIINKPLPRGKTVAFILNRTSTNSQCYYEDAGREKNLYRITVNHNPQLHAGPGYYTDKGVLLARPPS